MRNDNNLLTTINIIYKRINIRRLLLVFKRIISSANGYNGYKMGIKLFVGGEVMNKRIISLRELVRLNNYMLGRGAPNRKDNIGYNKPDYSICNNYKETISFRQASDISKRLNKYCATQLKEEVNIEELKASEEFYSFLADEVEKKVSSKDSKLNKTIIAIMQDDYLYLRFLYDIDLINLIKKYKGRWDGEKWILDSRYSLEIENKCKAYGYEYKVVSMNSNNKKNDEKVKSRDDGVIKGTCAGNIVYLTFKYDVYIISEIKKLKGKWDGEKWNMDKRYINNLKESITLNGYKLDLNETIDEVAVDEVIKNKKKSDKVKKRMKIKATEENGLIELTFSYSPIVVNAIKALPSKDRRWNPDDKKWILSKKGAEDFYNSLDKNKYNGDDIIKVLNGEDPVTELLEENEIEDNIISIGRKKEIVPYNIINMDNLPMKPFEHQKKVAEFANKKGSFILADAMGLGKTVSSILVAEGILGKRLIICPSILKYMWENEILSINPNAKIYIVEGQKNFPKDINDISYTIINYEILSYHQESIINESYDIMLADEAHYLKAIDNYGNPDSKRAEVALNLSKIIPYNIPITGTPIPNKTKDIFNLLKMIDHPLSKNFYKFAHKYCDAEDFGYGLNIEGSSNKEDLHKNLKGWMIRRLKCDMPKKVRKFIPVDVNLNEYNLKVWEYLNKVNKIDKENIKEEKENYEVVSFTKVDKLKFLNAMKMIIEIEKVKNAIEYVDNIIQQGESIVIFCNYRKSVDELKKYYGNNAVVVDGRVDEKTKNINVDRFQNGEVKVFIGNIKAAGNGITLTKSNNIVFVGFPWTSCEIEQAEDRIHRIGQEKICNIHYIYGRKAEIDNELIKMISKKMDNISTIIDNEPIIFYNYLIDYFDKKAKE